MFITKYADDTIVAGLLKDDDTREYINCIDYVCNWCRENFLHLNVSKTKELVWDFRRSRSRQAQPVTIGSMDVEVSEDYKYLGITIDNQFRFSSHVQVQCKKASKRLYFVRTLVKLNVKDDLIISFFKTVISPVLMYACVAFFGLLSKQLKDELSRPNRVCRRMLKRQYVIDDNDSYYAECVASLTNKIMQDSTHPLHELYELLPSGRRYRVLYARTRRFKDTFLPVSVIMLNNAM